MTVQTITLFNDENLFENPFNDLPFELLELIFEYLDPGDLRSLLSMTGRLYDVIVTSPISMRKLKLNLDENWNASSVFVRESGENVKDATFQYCNFDDPRQFRDLLKHISNVERLKVCNIHISAEVFTRKFRKFFIDLDRLRRLDVDNSQAVGKLLRLYLPDPQVTHLRMDFTHFNVTKEFVKLLWSQIDLTTLELGGFSEIMLRSLFPLDISYMIRFELKKLIFNCGIVSDANFLKCMEIFSETLEELEVHKELESMEFFKLMFKMEKLRALTLATNFITLKTFIDCIEAAKKSFHFGIKELTLVTRSQYGIEQPINFIVEKLKNLESLKVSLVDFLKVYNYKTLQTYYFRL